jgi:predicted AAA+ superfamily ATPase
MRPFSIEESELSLEYISLEKLLNQELTKIDGATELTLSNYLDEMERTSFPGIRDEPANLREILIKDYINQIAYHDFEENGFPVRKPLALIAWISAYACSIATTTKYTKILDISLKNSTEVVTKTTANTYRDALSLLNIIEDVEPFLPFGKLFKSISKTPKHFLIDSSLVLSLLNLNKDNLMKHKTEESLGELNKTFLGRLFEQYVYQSLRVYCDVLRAEMTHLRTNTGNREIDFIIQKGQNLVAIEVKSSVTISDKDVRHLNWFEDLAKSDFNISKVVIYCGKYAYTRKDNVHLIPAGLLGC